MITGHKDNKFSHIISRQLLLLVTSLDTEHAMNCKQIIWLSCLLQTSTIYRQLRCVEKGGKKIISPLFLAAGRAVLNPLIQYYFLYNLFPVIVVETISGHKSEKNFLKQCSMTKDISNLAKNTSKAARLAS